MNKIQLKNFAIWARKKLIADIELKASLIGISKDGIQQPSDASTSDLQFFEINGHITTLEGKDIQKRKTIVDKIRQKEEDTDYKTAFNYIVEEVAYTWFNRLIAIRYMEINDYLPSRTRVLSSSDNTEPEILKNYLDADLNLNEKEIEKIEQYKEEHKPDELFAFLFLKQCNALNEILPELFDNSLDYMEILLRIDFTSKKSVVYKLVNEVDEENFEDVEVVGWLYQYYNTEKKEQIDADVKKNIKITKETLPIKTQLFTPDWIVKYMVENSLGRLWLEKEENEDLKNSWKYYIEEAEQETEVKEQLEEIRKGYKNLDIEEIKIIDPCMGSGHILTYTFDVLMQIYESKGYSTREAVKSIIENNIYGIELSKRAYQLAYFAIMMKARQYDSRVFRRELKTNLCYAEEKSEIKFVEKFGSEQLIQCVRDLEDSDLLGSLVETDATDYENLIDTIENFNIIDLGVEYSNAPEKRIAILKNQLVVHKLLSQKYDVVITNPPYLGNRYINDKLKKYLEKNYIDSKADLFSACMERFSKMIKNDRYLAFLVPYVWLFIQTYEKLRHNILSNFNFNSIVQLEYNAFEPACIPVCFFILDNKKCNYKGTYIKLSDFKGIENQEPKMLYAINNDCDYKFFNTKENFSKIPGSPIAYWLSKKIYDTFNFDNLSKYYKFNSGKSANGKNEYYFKYWYEVNFKDIQLNFNLKELDKYKFLFLSKGGSFRKWFGNVDYITLKEFFNNYEEELQLAICWSDISSSKFSARKHIEGIGANNVTKRIYVNDEKYNYILALLNSNYAQYIFDSIIPTLHFDTGYIGLLPLNFYENSKIEIIVENNISISQNDWNSFETSYDFIRHPLLNYEVSIYSGLGDSDKECISHIKIDNNNGKFLIFEKDKPKVYRIEQSFEMYKDFCNNTFNKLKENEEKLNEMFIKIYGLENELTPEVEDKDITITKIFDNKEDITENIKGNKYILTKKDVIVNFISYAVGCMLGRYSLDIEGLAFAGGEWDDSKYTTFKPIDKNCLLILEEEIPELKEYDIVNKFEEFVEVVFGRDTLKENLKFIADALEIKGKNEYDIIRTYFVKEFYKEHTQMYKKCPIYWLFDAGKQNSFKALMYLHRYNTDTVGMINVEFLQKVQEAYERFKAIEEKAKIIEKYDKKLVELKLYLEKMAHISNIRIDLDLDDGVKVNYKKLQTGKDGNNLEILAKIK